MRSRRLRRAGVVALAGGLAVAACGGSSDDAGDGAVASGEVVAPVETAAPSLDPSELSATHVDLVGETVRPESEIESNLLPSVVVDDLTTDRKVNIRNLVPQDKPVLLWMYAPH